MIHQKSSQSNWNAKLDQLPPYRYASQVHWVAGYVSQAHWANPARLTGWLGYARLARLTGWLGIFQVQASTQAHWVAGYISQVHWARLVPRLTGSLHGLCMACMAWVWLTGSSLGLACMAWYGVSPLHCIP